MTFRRFLQSDGKHAYPAETPDTSIDVGTSYDRGILGSSSEQLRRCMTSGPVDFQDLLADVLHSPDAPVGVRAQVEGALLGLSKEELRERVRTGERNVQDVLALLGKTEAGADIAPKFFADWAETDPNVMSDIPWDKLSERRKLELTYWLWGFIGPSFNNVHVDEVSEIQTGITIGSLHRFPAAQVSLLRERVLFEATQGELKHQTKLQKAALVGELEDNFDHGVQWLERCHGDGRAGLAVDALHQFLEYVSIEDRLKLRQRLSWYTPEPFKDETEDVLALLNPEQVVAELAHRERLAVEQQSLPKVPRPARRRRFDPLDDLDPDAVQEERDIAPRPPVVPHPLPRLSSSGRHSNVREPFASAPLAIGIARFMRDHPNALVDGPNADKEVNEIEWLDLMNFRRSSDNPTMLQSAQTTIELLERILATIELCPREDIPDDVIDFLAEQFSRKDLAISRRLRASWQFLLESSDSGDARERLNNYLATKGDLRLVASSFPAQGEAVPNDVQAVQEYIRDPVLIRGTAAWLRQRRFRSLLDVRDVDKLVSELLTFLREEVAKQSDTQGYFFSGSSKSGKTHREQYWLENEFAPLVAVLSSKPKIPLDQAYALVSGIRTSENAHFLDTWLRNVPHEDAACWRLLEGLHEVPLVERAAFLIGDGHIGQAAYRKDIPRFTELIRRQVIEPMTLALRESHGRQPRHVLSQLLDCLNELASYDAKEAVTQFHQCLEDQDFRHALSVCLCDSSESYFERDNVSRPLLRLCYADIVYARPVLQHAVDRWERGDKFVPLPVARALDMEAQSGVVWSPRNVPLIQPEVFADGLIRIVRDQEYPARQGNHSATGDVGSGEGNGEQEAKEDRERQLTMEEMRDQLLWNIDNPQAGGMGDADSPDLPYAGMLSENPKELGTLSKPLTGDARYILTKISGGFDEWWLAHLPIERGQHIDSRPLLHRTVEGGESVTLTLRAAHGAVVPLSLSGQIESVDLPESATLRWAGHWTKRIETAVPVTMGVQYSIGEDRAPGSQTLAEIRETIPSSLLQDMGSLSSSEDLPSAIRQRLAVIDLEHTPLGRVVAEVASLVHQYYEYHFIVNHPEYREKYRELLKKMPFDATNRNEYLAFIHSLREEHEEVLGRGVCGQLSTVLVNALRSIGVPAFFATGFCPSDTKITTNDLHAWVLVPFMDADGKLFMKPVESTGGGVAGLDQIRSESERVKTQEAAEPAVPSNESPSVIPAPADETLLPPRLRDQTDEWCDALKPLLHLPDGQQLTRENVLTAQRLISAVHRVGRQRRNGEMPDPQAAAEAILDPQSSQEALSLGDTLLPGHLITPWIRSGILELQTILGERLAPATRSLLFLLVREGETAWQKYLGGFESSEKEE